MFHWFKRHNQQGLEVPDPTPHEITLTEAYKRPLTIAEQIARFTRASDLEKALNKHGMDTLEDADDLDVPFDPIIETSFGRTPYEAREDHLDGFQTHLDEVNGQIVQEPSEERLDRARERIKAVRAEGRPKPAPDQPAPTGGAVGSNGEATNNHPHNPKS